MSFAARVREHRLLELTRLVAPAEDDLLLDRFKAVIAEYERSLDF